MPRNEGLIPSLQRKFWTGVGSAGDTAGNFVHANGRTIQTTARTAAASIDGLGRSVSASGKSANKTGNTYAQALGRQVESYGAAAGKRVGAVGKAVDGSGRAVGGESGRFWEWCEGCQWCERDEDADEGQSTGIKGETDCVDGRVGFESREGGERVWCDGCWPLIILIIGT